MRSRAALAALTLSTIVPLAAGCGGGSATPAVASIGSGGTDSAPAPGGPGPAGSAQSGGGPSGSGFGMSLNVADGGKFAACMRAHGVATFPDPNAQGDIQIGPGSGIDPGSTAFQSAQRSCASLLPNGGRPSPQRQAAMQRLALAHSACMRRHGLPDFPDPTFSGGGVSLSIKVGGGTDLDPRSPLFQAAQRACQGRLPGKPVGAATGTG